MTEPTSENFVCCSGGFPFVPILDSHLRRRSQITTSVLQGTRHRGKSVSRNHFCRIVRAHDSLGESVVVATSSLSRPHSVNLYDVVTGQQLCRLFGHRGPVWGLSTPLTSPSSHQRLSSLYSPSLILSGGFGDSQLLLFDTLTGRCLQRLPDAPERTLRLLCESSPSVVTAFAGVERGRVYQYDVGRSTKIAEFSGGHGEFARVWGLSHCLRRGLLFSAGTDRRVLVWDWKNVRKKRKKGRTPGRSSPSITVLRLSSKGYCCSYASEAQLLLVGLQSGEIEAWDLRKTATTLAQFRVCREDVNDIVQMGKRCFVSGSSAGAVSVISSHRKAVPSVTAERTMAGRVYGVCCLNDVASARLVPLLPEESGSLRPMDEEEGESETETGKMTPRERYVNKVRGLLGRELEKLWVFYDIWAENEVVPRIKRSNSTVSEEDDEIESDEDEDDDLSLSFVDLPSDELRTTSIDKFVEGRFEEVISALTELIVRRNSSDAEAFALRGWCWCYLGNFQASIDDLSKAAEMNPNDWFPLVGRCLSSCYLKRLGEAVADAAAVLVREDQDAMIKDFMPSVWFCQAICFHLQGSSPSEVQTAFGQACRSLKPVNSSYSTLSPLFHRVHGMVLRSQGKRDEALVSFSRAIRFHDVLAARSRARIHFEQSNFDAAIRDLTAVVTSAALPHDQRIECQWMRGICLRLFGRSVFSELDFVDAFSRDCEFVGLGNCLELMKDVSEFLEKLPEIPGAAHATRLSFQLREIVEGLHSEIWKYPDEDELEESIETDEEEEVESLLDESSFPEVPSTPDDPISAIEIIVAPDVDRPPHSVSSPSFLTVQPVVNSQQRDSLRTNSDDEDDGGILSQVVSETSLIRADVAALKKSTDQMFGQMNVRMQQLEGRVEEMASLQQETHKLLQRLTSAILKSNGEQ